MNPILLRAILRSGELVVRKRERLYGCFRLILRSCLLLMAICIAFLVILTIGLYFLYETVVIPIAEQAKFENFPGAMHNANLYLKDIGLPLPHDVILGEALESFARARGYQEYFGELYQPQSCIAAADRFGIKRQHLCALMDLEGGWPSEIGAYTFVIANVKAQELIQLGYKPNNPNKAMLAYFGGNQEYLEVFLQLSQTWEIAGSASVNRMSLSEKLRRYPALVIKFWTLKNMGLGELTYVNGVPIIIIDYGTPPPNNLPAIPDGTFTRPVIGGKISGNTFGRYWDGSPFPQHRGTDYGGGDGWVRGAHNGVVTYAEFLPQSSDLAAELWISGNTVILKSQFPDGTPFCTGYGHGANLMVQPGQQVNAGDVLFRMGDTGLADGVHAHLFIRVGGSGPYCSGGYFVDLEAILP